MRRSTAYTLLILGAVFVAAGCSSSSNNNDGGNDSGTTVVDSGTVEDAGTTDAGETDAGMTDGGEDAGVADAGEDAGMLGDGGCVDFSGFYLPSMTATCDNNVAVPQGACVSQVGCAVTATTDQLSLSGTATGADVTLSGDVSIGSGTAHEVCTGTLASGMVTLNCTITAGSVTATCTIPATRADTPMNASSVCCDPFAAQSTCMGADRCTYTLPSGSAVAASACLPSNGTVMEGGACTRSGGAGGADPGYDNCSAGLFCSRTGLASTASRVCQKLCQKGSDCTGNTACISVNGIPAGGTCVNTCTFFGADCPMDTTCRPAHGFDATGADASLSDCTATGMKAVGDACTRDTDCVASSVCKSGFCRELFDDTHMCTDVTATCTSLNNAVGTAFGYCKPAPPPTP